MNNTPKHTRAPWHPALPDTVKDGHWAHIENGNRLIAFIYGKNDAENEANARVIAAAPELLEACKAVSGLSVPQASAQKDVWLARGQEWIAAIEQARAAIAKAEGL